MVSTILARAINLIIWTCGLPPRWHLKLVKVFPTSVVFVWDNIGWKVYLKNHKRCFDSLKEGHLSNKCLKTKGCYYCKGIRNSAICNEREEKEIIETTSNLSSSKKEMILDLVYFTT